MHIIKPKELTVDFSRKQQRAYPPLSTNRTLGQMVTGFKHLRVNITEDLRRTQHAHTQVSKRQKESVSPPTVEENEDFSSHPEKL